MCVVRVSRMYVRNTHNTQANERYKEKHTRGSFKESVCMLAWMAWRNENWNENIKYVICDGRTDGSNNISILRLHIFCEKGCWFDVVRKFYTNTTSM